MVCSQHSHLFSGKLRKTEDALALVTDPGLCCVWCGSGPAERQSSSLAMQHLPVPGRLRHSPCAALPTHISFSLQLLIHAGKQSRSHLISLQDGVSVRQGQGTIPSPTRAYTSPQHQNKLLRLPLYLSPPSAFWLWASQEQMTDRSLTVVLEFPKAQLLSN